MTRDEIERRLEVCEAATPEPWIVEREYDGAATFWFR